jgi:hypothetical protein
MKYAEDLLVEKDRDYVQGFFDAVYLLTGYAQEIHGKVAEDKRFDKLESAIGELFSVAAECHEEHIKKRFGITLKVEQEKEQHAES